MFGARYAPVLSEEGQSGVIMRQPKFGYLWAGEGNLVGGGCPWAVYVLGGDIRPQ